MIFLADLYNVLKKFFITVFYTENGGIDIGAVIFLAFLIAIIWIVKQGYKSIIAIQNTTGKDQFRMIIFFMVYTTAMISMPFLDSAKAGIASIITSISVTAIITYMQEASSRGSQKQIIMDIKSCNTDLQREYIKKVSELKEDYNGRLKDLENKLFQLEHKLEGIEGNQKGISEVMGNSVNNLLDNQEKTLKLIGQIKRSDKFRNNSLRRKAKR